MFIQSLKAFWTAVAWRLRLLWHIHYMSRCLAGEGICEWRRGHGNRGAEGLGSDWCRLGAKQLRTAETLAHRLRFLLQ